MVQGELPDAPGVGVFGDVALTAAVDENAAHQLLGIDEDRDFGGVHVGQIGAQGLGHPDRLAVVLLDGGGRPPGDARGVTCHHRVVVGEAPGGQHHAGARPNREFGAVPAGADAGDPAVGFDDQALHPDVIDRAGACGGGGVDQGLHQHVPSAGFALLLVLHLWHMAARGGVAMVLNG